MSFLQQFISWVNLIDAQNGGWNSHIHTSMKMFFQEIKKFVKKIYFK